MKKPVALLVPFGVLSAVLIVHRIYKNYTIKKGEKR